MLFGIVYLLQTFLFLDLTLNVLFLFFLVCVSSLCAFLSFCTLSFFLVFYYIRMLFSRYLVFFLTASVSHRTLHLGLGFVGMHYAAAATSMQALTKFSYSSFRVSPFDIT